MNSPGRKGGNPENLPRQHNRLPGGPAGSGACRTAAAPSGLILLSPRHEPWELAFHGPTPSDQHWQESLSSERNG